MNLDTLLLYHADSSSCPIPESIEAITSLLQDLSRSVASRSWSIASQRHFTVCTCGGRCGGTSPIGNHHHVYIEQRILQDSNGCAGNRLCATQSFTALLQSLQSRTTCFIGCSARSLMVLFVVAFVVVVVVVFVVVVW